MSFRTDAANKQADRLIQQIQREKARREAQYGTANQRINDLYGRQASDIQGLHQQVAGHNTGLTGEINQSMDEGRFQIEGANAALQQHLGNQTRTNRRGITNELKRLGLNQGILGLDTYDANAQHQQALSQQRAGYENQNMQDEQLRLGLLGDQLAGLNTSAMTTGLERADYERDQELDANRLGWEDYLQQVANELEDAEIQRQQGLEDAAWLDANEKSNDFVPFEPWGSNFTPWGSNFTPWGSNFTPWGSGGYGGSTYQGDFEEPTGNKESGVDPDAAYNDPLLGGFHEIGDMLGTVLDNYYQDVGVSEARHDQATAKNAYALDKAREGYSGPGAISMDEYRLKQDLNKITNPKNATSLDPYSQYVAAQKAAQQREVARHDRARVSTEQARADALRRAQAKQKALALKKKKMIAAEKKADAARARTLKAKRAAKKRERTLAMRRRSVQLQARINANARGKRKVKNRSKSRAAAMNRGR